MGKVNSSAHESEINVQSEGANDPRVKQALGLFADLKALEVTPASQSGAREILSAVSVRKPKNNEFIRVSTDPHNSLTTLVFEDKDEGETYLIAPGVRPLMIAGAAIKMLTLTVNQMATPFIWPVPVDDEHTRKNAWNESARIAYHKAKAVWVKLVGDRAAGYYRIYVAEGDLPSPRWPERTFAELLQIAFHNRMIETDDHAIVKAMRGLTV
jgi:hypothetical protein